MWNFKPKKRATQSRLTSLFRISHLSATVERDLKPPHKRFCLHAKLTMSRKPSHPFFKGPKSQSAKNLITQPDSKIISRQISPSTPDSNEMRLLPTIPPPEQFPAVARRFSMRTATTMHQDCNCIAAIDLLEHPKNEMMSRSEKLSSGPNDQYIAEHNRKRSIPSSTSTGIIDACHFGSPRARYNFVVGLQMHQGYTRNQSSGNESD
jgi:hypothetical protein